MLYYGIFSITNPIHANYTLICNQMSIEKKISLNFTYQGVNSRQISCCLGSLESLDERS